MKVVINSCYGGFSLSRTALKRLAELNGRECYFFTHEYKTGKFTPIDIPKGMFWTAFDIPNPNEVLGNDKKDIKAYNEKYRKHNLTARPDNRHDPLLVQVVEELGDEANGDCAKLRIVEIPDGIDYEINEYDGNESVHEVHGSWY